MKTLTNSPESFADRVVVLVVHYSDVAQTARAAAMSAALAHRAQQVIVINNNPAEPGHGALAKALPAGVRLITTDENLGYAGGNNIGLQLAMRQRSAEYAWILNPDAQPDPAALAELVTAADFDPSALIIGSCILRGGSWRTGEIVFAGATGDPQTGEVLPLSPDSTGPIVESDLVHGSSMLVRLSGLPNVGLIPEEYFLYCEEYDFALRARAAGWRVLVSRRSKVSHLGPWRGGLPTPAFVYYMTRNRLLFSRRWGFPRGQSFGLMAAERLRNRLSTRRPGLVGQIDELIGRAVDDALDDVWGRNPWVESFAWARREPGVPPPPGPTRLRRVWSRVARRP